MKLENRTKLAVVLFIPLAMILLATFACLPAPVGDPATAKVDDSLSGVWRQVVKNEGADKSTMLVLMQPWDVHTYLLEMCEVDTKDGQETHQISHYKAWLTELGGKTFLVCEPMDHSAALVGVAPADKYWAVLRIEKAGEMLEAKLVKDDSDWIKAVDKAKATRADMERIIKEHVNDDALYGDPISFKKLGQSDAESVKGILQRVGIR